MTLKQFSRAFDAQKIGETKMSIEDGSQYSDLITGTSFFFWRERERERLSCKENTKPLFINDKLYTI